MINNSVISLFIRADTTACQSDSFSGLLIPYIHHFRLIFFIQMSERHFLPYCLGRNA
ncbi:hypothetical protein ACMWPM_03150 [Helicobacter pylori]|uniref:hypothetical protein n=1 Tax=Helicobacter pylori TaxID=210 RepID=UPI0039DFB3A8